MSINNFYHQIPSEQQQQQQQLWLEASPTSIPNASSSSNSSSPSPSPSKLPSHPSNWHHIPNWLSVAHNQNPSSPNSSAALNFNLSPHDSDSGAGREENEGMFEKPLTPSDVGKLNRLVIPKQHAERYFPLGGDAAEKGLLLSFEDESGKCWRFRYSYWNSSQSYVLTKGWSRYVKEKQLDAGDVVFFQRRRSDADRLFIGWRRRGNNINNTNSDRQQQQQHYSQAVGGSTVAQPYLEHGGGGGEMLMQLNNAAYQQPECLHAPGGLGGGDKETSGGRTLRLFGVNMEWQPEYEPSSSPVADPAPARRSS